MPSVHPSTSIEDAVEQLDTRTPLLYRELVLIAKSLYDLGFQRGKQEGAQAANVAAAFTEYQDTTAAIRERLTYKARHRETSGDTSE